MPYNFMGEKAYTNYAAWKRAAKAAGATVIEGNSKIANAIITGSDGKFLKGVGEWDGEIGTIYKPTPGMTDNPYRKEELADWFRIKRQHPSAVIRSRTTPKGITRLAIWGLGKKKHVVPVSFLRYKKNPRPKAIYPLLTGLFALALLKLASMTRTSSDIVVDDAEVMCSCQMHATMHRKGDHG